MHVGAQHVGFGLEPVGHVTVACRGVDLGDDGIGYLGVDRVALRVGIVGGGQDGPVEGPVPGREDAVERLLLGAEQIGDVFGVGKDIVGHQHDGTECEPPLPVFVIEQHVEVLYPAEHVLALGFDLGEIAAGGRESQ